MELRNNWYKADKGKHFVHTEKGKKECAGYKNKTVGKIEWFQGFEEIYCQNDLVYECTYHGGIL